MKHKTFYLVFFIVMMFSNVYIYFKIRKKNSQKIYNSSEKQHYYKSYITRSFKYTKILIYLLAISQLIMSSLSTSDDDPSLTLGTISIVMALLSLLLFWKSMSDLGGNFSPCDIGIIPEKRVNTWPYRYFKHPIYFANILQMISVLIIYRGPYIIVAFILLLITYASSIVDEERAMKKNEVQ